VSIAILFFFQDEKFRSAFYFALRDTLVAKDLDQATRIAYQVSSESTVFFFFLCCHIAVRKFYVFFFSSSFL
jgi:hypothetical protein